MENEKGKEENLSQKDNIPNLNNHNINININIPSYINSEKKKNSFIIQNKDIDNNINSVNKQKSNNNNKSNNINENENKILYSYYQNIQKNNGKNKGRNDNNDNNNNNNFFSKTRDTTPMKNKELVNNKIENSKKISNIFDIKDNLSINKEEEPLKYTLTDEKRNRKEEYNSEKILNISCDVTEKFKNTFKIKKIRNYSIKIFESNDIKKESLITFMSNNSDFIFTDSDFIPPKNLNENEIISLGINIGAQKTVYSTFSKVNEKYISHVLLMNNSSRIIPSIICYTKTHRLFGENSITSLKQNLDTSHINLSRLIGFEKDIKIYEEEIKFELKEINEIENHKFLLKNPEGDEEIESDVIISDFLFLINLYYFKNEKYTYSSTYISIPDYFTCYQKQQIQIIFNALNMNDVHILNESSAITMYYGYTKYRDNFVKQKINVDTTIEKYILFIDSGHSKTSFILSYFRYNLFKVIYVTCIPNIGGRNFDQEIMNYCINEFLIKENIKKEDFNLTDKMKYRLLESIKKSRIQLTVNTESQILVDVFYNDIDLDIILTREKFEELIKNDLKNIDNYFDNLLQYAKNKNITIDCVEIAGELMRTPILQKMIEKKNLKISKSLLIDECTSVGSALLGNYIKGNLPIANYKFFFHYNYYRIMYQISYNKKESNDEKNVLIDIGTIEFNEGEKKIILKKDFIVKNKPIYFKIFYDKENNNNVELFTEKLYLKILKINLYKILIDNNCEIENIKQNSLVLKITFNPSQYSTTEELLYDNKKLNAKIEYISGCIYKSENEKKEFKKNIYKQLKKHKNFDEVYNKYVTLKNAISRYLYNIKPKIQNIQILNDELKEIDSIDKKFRSVKEKENVSLEQYEIQLKNIILRIIDKLLNLKKKEKNKNINIIQSLEKLKNKLNDDINNFDIKEFIEFLENEEL